MPYKDAEKKKQMDRAYYRANAAKVKRRERRKYKRRRLVIRKRRQQLVHRHRNKNAGRERARYAALRLEVIAAYGGKCRCCGEAEPKFLELDHTNGDGAAHRKMIGRGSAACYRWLKKKGFPREGFQLLCANCNQGRIRNGGVCPHRTSNSVLWRNGQSNFRGKKKPN